MGVVILEKDHPWIIFSYKVPSEPSTLRVRIWRNLKEMGVIYIQQSICVAPDNPDTRKKIQQIQKLIEGHNGEALFLEIIKCSESTEDKLVSIFNQQRKAEYEEFFEGCRNFIKEIETETAKEKFTFHEVEENEVELIRLKRWFRKIIKRDFFACPLLDEAKHLLDRCEEMLVEFTNSVYRTEGYSEGKIKSDDLLE